GKKLAELDLSEMATIAGLAQAPSRYSPVRDKKRALERRDVVLDRMAEHGFVSTEEASSAKSADLVLRPMEDRFGTVMPYYAEHIRRYITEKYGAEQLMTGGLRIEAAAEPVVEAMAYENVIFGARKQDKRQGWRGPEAHLEGKKRDTFLERAKELYGQGPLDPDRRYLGLVEELQGRAAKVNVGGTVYDLPLRNMNWASKWRVRPAVNDQTIGSVSRALEVGDVIWVKKPAPVTESYRDWFLADGVNPRWRPAVKDRRLERFVKENQGKLELEQVSHPQAAIFTGDHKTGYVVSLVGGVDYARSEYNRAIQACRQPGSTYKPIYYSAALDRGYGFDTTLNDIPRAEVDPVTGEVWVPENLGGTVDNRVTLEYALVFSKNVPSVDIFKKVGADEVEKWARRLGFTTEIIADKALALGASCTVLPELTKAFAIFARNGKDLDWAYVRRVFDREGNLIEDNTVFYDPDLSPDESLDRLHAMAGIRAKQAISARAGYLINKLLSQTIKFGFSWIIRQIGINAAGKTGTSSATMDTLFVAYTSRWIASVWMGDDLRERPLGDKDAAYMTVEPMWARYIAEAAEGHPNQEIPWETPEGVKERDRGDNKGARGGPMPLVYKKTVRPTTTVAPIE
ncbi:MAG: transglycosylase domain-containing protein, partial [Deltaproteobacteria bacterium]|nr:transglycosylase domain-containing protein [Deltaproteobacteria bacterium]